MFVYLLSLISLGSFFRWFNHTRHERENTGRHGDPLLYFSSLLFLNDWSSSQVSHKMTMNRLERRERVSVSLGLNLAEYLINAARLNINVLVKLENTGRVYIHWQLHFHCSPIEKGMDWMKSTSVFARHDGWPNDRWDSLQIVDEGSSSMIACFHLARQPSLSVVPVWSHSIEPTNDWSRIRDEHKHVEDGSTIPFTKGPLDTAVIDAWGIDNSDRESCWFDADRERERESQWRERRQLIYSRVRFVSVDFVVSIVCILLAVERDQVPVKSFSLKSKQCSDTFILKHHSLHRSVLDDDDDDDSRAKQETMFIRSSSINLFFNCFTF